MLRTSFVEVILTLEGPLSALSTSLLLSYHARVVGPRTLEVNILASPSSPEEPGSMYQRPQGLMIGGIPITKDSTSPPGTASLITSQQARQVGLVVSEPRKRRWGLWLSLQPE